MRIGLVLAFVSTLLMAGAGAAQAQTCSGDCDGNRVVTIDELIKAVGIALGSTAAGDCLAADADASGTITIDELGRPFTRSPRSESAGTLPEARHRPRSG